MAKNEKTSLKVASIASHVLRDPHMPKWVKSLAASALTQRPDHRRKK